MKQFDSLIQNINSKPTWGSKELVAIINPIKQSIIDQLKSGDKLVVYASPSKKSTVSVIKKYDVIYAELMGIPHYMIVHRVKNGLVHGVTLSTKNKPWHTLCEIMEDRHFMGSYASNSYLTVDEMDAKENFVRVFESRKEADKIFRLIKEYYKNALSL